MADKLKPFIKPAEVRRIVASIAAEIKDDYEGKSPVLLGVLKGAFVFMSDLIRVLDGLDLEVDFIQAESYGERDEPAHEALIIRDLTTEIKDRHVIVVEGIIDRGRTMQAVLAHLLSKEPASLRLCTLLLRESHKTGTVIDYFGKRIGDGFVVGYGMDYKGNYRNLPSISLLTQKNGEKNGGKSGEGG
jgi:hypoxanthine phosphoribosyltransferase